MPSHPEVPLVGLMLLVSLPFGASIKQSVPRVKLSHRGKILINTFFHFIVHTNLYSITNDKTKDKWTNVLKLGYIIISHKDSNISISHCSSSEVQPGPVFPLVSCT